MDPGSTNDHQDDQIADSGVLKESALTSPGQRSNRESKSFLPHSEIMQILGVTTVADILKTVRNTAEYSHDSISAEKDICGESENRRRIRIFAILMFINKPCYIAGFKKNDIWDDQLPLDAQTHGEIFQGWEPRDVWIFCKWQYKMLAPVFDCTTTQHYQFSLKHPMPFLDELVFRQERSGAHGSVSKIRIHGDHQIWKSQGDRRDFYAVKRFHHNDNDTFWKERDALAKFSPPNEIHRHLIELLFSYETGADQFMVFPWADSNLQEFWKSNQSQPSAQGDLVWLIRQCHGLSDGLSKVHRYHGQDDDGGDDVGSEILGRHGDIKPKNILFFGSQSGRGRLVVADFTLMRFHAPNDDNTEARNVGFSRTYRPPELECEDKVSISQKYDIWTLGCVFLEFLTWHLVGYDAIHEKRFRGADGVYYASFNEVRVRDDEKEYGLRSDKFFNPDGNIHHEPRAKVKDSVKKWIAFLKRHPNASPASRAFLRFILDRMLVISPNNRCSMKVVRRELGKILDICEEGTGTEFFLPAPLSPFPPLFPENERYEDNAVTDSFNTTSNSRTDWTAFEEMGLSQRGNGGRSREMEENLPLPPQVSVGGELGQTGRGSKVPQQYRGTSRISELETQCIGWELGSWGQQDAA
ncbi:Mitogen-activated protein kinase 12 [Colletotrichum tropicale]|nr:Mitogen-activated protein kinase 12 [Colletotrichum tropicale]